MAKIVTINGQKYQIGALGGIRKIGADGKPTGGAVSASVRAAIKKKMSTGSSTKPIGFMTDKPIGAVQKPNTDTIPKTKSAILSNLKKSFSLDNDILQYMMKNTPGDALKQVITSNKADQKSLISKAKNEMKVNQKGPKPRPKAPSKSSGAESYRPGRGDSKLPPKKKDAKNPDAAYKSARDKQRRAGKLSNKSVRDTSIKDARPARGPAYDTKAPKKTTSQKAIEAIRKRNEKAVNPLSKAMLGRIEKKLKEGGKPVYKDGMVVGVTHKGLIGTVYTGRPDSNPFKKQKKKRD